MPDFVHQLRSVLSPAYDLERELVGGGMSRVFVATEKALGRTVVIKVLPPELAAGVNRDRFQREIQLAARLHHPHIVPLLNAGEHGPVLYYSMPFIEGESLKEALRRRGRLPVREVVRILHDIVDALAYAHARGVVHRDIKPGNILTQGTHALVTDFGVAKALSAALPISGTTSAGIAIGTPAYMAPEQLAADPKADHRMDIYAVGLLAYELLTGDSPFVSASPQETLAAQLTRMPTPLDQCCPDVPPALSSIIMRCLEKSPAQRPPTAEALLDELDAVTTPQGALLAPPAGRATAPGIAGRRDASDGGSGGGERPWSRAESDATTPIEEPVEWPPRRRWSTIFLGAAAALLLAAGGVFVAMRTGRTADSTAVAAADSARTPAASRPREPRQRTRTPAAREPSGDTSIAGAFRGAAVPGLGGRASAAAAPRAATGTGASAATPLPALRPQLTRADSLAIAEAVRRDMRRDAGVPPDIAARESLARAVTDSVARTLAALRARGYLDAQALDSGTLRELERLRGVRLIPMPAMPAMPAPGHVGAASGRRRIALLAPRSAGDSPELPGLGQTLVDSLQLEITRRGVVDAVDATPIAQQLRTPSAGRVAGAAGADLIMRGDYHVRPVGVVVHLTLTDLRTGRSLTVYDTLPSPAPARGAMRLAQRVSDGMARIGVTAGTAPVAPVPPAPPTPR